jgi:uncharacterized protein (DUF1015 family)
MTEFKAFRGLRYDAVKVGDLAKVVAPPYDVISPADRDRFLAADPHSVVRLILPSAREQLDGTDAEAYQRAAASLRAWLAEGVLAEDPEPCFYAYEQVATVGGERLRRRGVIGALRLAAFAEGKVLPHEHTHAGPKRDRFELMKACDASLSPIFALYPDNSGKGAACVEAMCSAADPLLSVTFDGIEHRLWRVSDPALCRAMAEAVADQTLYIADGHHRYETALAYRDACGDRYPEGGADFVTAACYSMQDPGLRILPTHRALKCDAAKLLAGAAAEAFTVTPQACADVESFLAALAGAPEGIGLYRRDGGYAILTLRDAETMRRAAPEQSDAWRALPVAILDELLLARAVGGSRQEAVAEGRLAYVKNAADAVRGVDAGSWDAAFLLNSTPLEALEAVASHGERMPAKSTYFHPKLLSGLLMRLLH